MFHQGASVKNILACPQVSVMNQSIVHTQVFHLQPHDGNLPAKSDAFQLDFGQEQV